MDQDKHQTITSHIVIPDSEASYSQRKVCRRKFLKLMAVGGSTGEASITGKSGEFLNSNGAAGMASQAMSTLQKQEFLK